MASKLYSIFSKTEQQRSSCKQQKGGFPTSLVNNDRVFEDDFRPLSVVADTFEELSTLLKAKGFAHDLDLKTLCRACQGVSVLFGCLGIAFKFAELEYCSKVNDLQTASENFKTVNNILKFDVQNETVKTSGSLSRNLRRVRQGLDLIRALFQNFLSSEDCCLKEAATMAYTDTCAAYHTWTVRTAVYAGMYALPTRDQLLNNLNETGKSAEREMKRYINASLPVIEYIDSLYASRGISLDW